MISYYRSRSTEKKAQLSSRVDQLVRKQETIMSNQNNSSNKTRSTSSLQRSSSLDKPKENRLVLVAQNPRGEIDIKRLHNANRYYDVRPTSHYQITLGIYIS